MSKALDKYREEHAGSDLMDLVKERNVQYILAYYSSLALNPQSGAPTLDEAREAKVRLKILDQLLELERLLTE